MEPEEKNRELKQMLVVAIAVIVVAALVFFVIAVRRHNIETAARNREQEGVEIGQTENLTPLEKLKEWTESFTGNNENDPESESEPKSPYYQMHAIAWNPDDYGETVVTVPTLTKSDYGILAAASAYSEYIQESKDAEMRASVTDEEQENLKEIVNGVIDMLSEKIKEAGMNPDVLKQVIDKKIDNREIVPEDLIRRIESGDKQEEIIKWLAE